MGDDVQLSWADCNVEANLYQIVSDWPGSAPGPIPMDWVNHFVQGHQGPLPTLSIVDPDVLLQGRYFVRSCVDSACSEWSNLALARVCGNHRVDAGEQCDDRNTDDGDGCTAACQVE
ncbi:MAG: hypothetical protein HY791_06200 [Deltaproteobacteria bacterium]|nr:hypothetical protein [Deltaproteobacteria bacterium]